MGIRFFVMAAACALVVQACGNGASNNSNVTTNNSNIATNNPDVSPAATDFQFGPVEVATDPIGLASDPQGAQYLAAKVDDEFVFAKRDAPGEEWVRLETDLEEVPRAYAYADGVHLAVTSERGLVRSTDEGATWSDVAADFDQRAFVVDGVFHLVDDENVLFKSTDGGMTWTEVGPLPREDNARLSVEVVSNGDLYLTEVSGPQHRSTDGGVTWTPITSPPASVSDLHAVVDADGDVVQFAASTGTELYTRTNDEPWTEVDFADGFPTFRLFYEAFWFDGAPYLVFSDGGINHVAKNVAGEWEVVWSDSTRAEAFLEGFDVWKGVPTVIFGRLGTMIVQLEVSPDSVDEQLIRFERENAEIEGVGLFEHDGSIKALISVYRPISTDGDFDNPSTLNHELFWSESDDGESWSDVRSLGIEGARFPVEDALATDGARLVLLDATDGLAVRISDDGGASFRKVSVGEIGRVTRHPSVHHVGGDDWFIVSGDGSYYRSTDGAESWEPVSLEDRVVTAGEGRLFAMDFDLQPYESTDLGRTWDDVSYSGDRDWTSYDGVREARMDFVDGHAWYLCCGWNVVRSGDEWTRLDALNDFVAGDVVGGSAGIHIYGNDEEAAEMVIRRQDASIVYVSTDLSGAVEPEHVFLEAAYFEGAHIIAVADRDEGRLNLLRRDPDDFTKGR